eukprot:813534_1
MDWVEFNDAPDKTLDILLKCIRFELFDKNYIVQIVAQWPLWFKTSQRKALIVATLSAKEENQRRLLSVLGVGHIRKKRFYTSVALLPSFAHLSAYSYVFG